MTSRNPLRQLPTLLRTYSTQPPPPPFTGPIDTPIDPPPASASKPKAATTTPTPRRFARAYPERKAFLFDYYQHLLNRSQMVLLFDYDNLSARHLGHIRNALKAVPPPTAPLTRSSGKGSPKAAQAAAAALAVEPATMTITRTGVLSAVFRRIPDYRAASLRPWLRDQRAIVTAPNVSPTHLNKVLRSIEKSIKQCKKDNVPDEKQPRLSLVVGIVEQGRLVSKEEIERIAKLPELDTLRGQVVGMIEGQGRSLLGVLSQAGGGGLVRTLQGLEKDLEEKQGGEAKPQEAAS